METFRKQREFQTCVEAIQTVYITKEGWPRDWFSARWSHITKPDKENLNLTPVLRQTVLDWEKSHDLPFPWHNWHGIRSSRNLHSSQVLGLTLFGSFAGDNLKFLGRALASEGLLKPSEVVQRRDFEYKPPNFFNEPVRTSVDCMLLIGNPGEVGSPIYFEVKFLEANFGQCTKKTRGLCNGLPQLAIIGVADRCPLSNQGIRYWDLLAEIIDSSTPKLGCPLQGPYYQLARNLLHLAREGGRAFIVLSDARTSYLDEEVLRFVDFLSPRYRHFVHHMKFQQLVPYVDEANRSVAELLSEKYGIE